MPLAKVRKPCLVEDSSQSRFPCMRAEHEAPSLRDRVRTALRALRKGSQVRESILETAPSVRFLSFVRVSRSGRMRKGSSDLA